MAEEKAEEKKDAPEKAESPKKAKSSGGKQNLLLFFLLIVNMTVVGGVGYMVYQARMADEKSNTLDKIVEGESMNAEVDKKEAEDFIGQLIPLEMFLVNLSGDKGNRLLKVSMELEIDGQNVKEEIEKRKPQIRDIIIVLLSSKTYPQISSKEGKEYLREEIKDTLNSFLTRGKVKRVLFTEFIFS